MNTHSRPARIIAEPTRWLTSHRPRKFAPAIQLASQNADHQVVVLADDAERLVREIESVAELFGHRWTVPTGIDPEAHDREVMQYRAALQDAAEEIERLRRAYDDLALATTPEATDDDEDQEVPA